ncbi:FAD-dependent oxidoreductase [Methylopila sp. Yamaguchi]|uniref:FAD-dependent oxidoreductase n=1 Tax=Methylopila sp. Yamaguchi TaxID=1437817 RepID=UPI000CAD18C3|nr:FAD-dependent oxidoreductase [Methylopila sp. Yamaguchi]GBD50122.1 FAD-dependent pyridine nucleotide-disulfide oxidoreductase [Methylopila sp. Yamaguchi]
MAGSAARKVAVVGSGPSGFYAAEALLEAGAEVDMLERLPTPFGLVRFGVAPDHPKLKSVCQNFTQIAGHERFAFFGNVALGRDVTIDELRSFYDAVVIASGASTDRKLGVPGEDLPGSWSATEFVSWYNGHPDFRDRSFDLSCEAAVIVGHGNVAIDVCRILLKSVDELRRTDICAHALEALAESRIRDVHLVGRRGPAQAKWTVKELREIGMLANADVVLDDSDLALGETCEAELRDPRGVAAAQSVKILRTFQGRPRERARAVHLHFNLSPRALQGDHCVERALFDRCRLSGGAFAQVAQPTGETVALETGAVFRSVGYKGVATDGVPFDNRSGAIPHERGRVMDRGEPAPGLYVAGWIKRGPSGVIGVNRACSLETVATMLADFADRPSKAPGRAALRTSLAARGVRPVDFTSWSRIDAAEVEAGAAQGKPREKFTAVSEMLAAAFAGATSVPQPRCA